MEDAGIAQLVEQRTENPRVTSSSLVPGKPYADVPSLTTCGWKGKCAPYPPLRGEEG
jgi:hypothetical protein